MRFVPVSSPDGRDIGWIATELIVSISQGGRYFKFKDGDRIANGKVPYGMPDDLVLKACGIVRDSDTLPTGEDREDGLRAEQRQRGAGTAIAHTRPA